MMTDSHYCTNYSLTNQFSFELSNQAMHLYSPLPRLTMSHREKRKPPTLRRSLQCEPTGNTPIRALTQLKTNVSPEMLQQDISYH